MEGDSTSRKATLLMLLVFVLGIALGALGMYAARGRVFGDSGGLRRADGRAKLEERLTRELSLSPEQQKQLDSILLDLQERYDAIHKQYAPQVDQVRQQGRDQVRTILAPEQRPKYEDFLRRIDEERKRMDEERRKNSGR